MVTGEEGHAGTLPKVLRKNAMHGAARMIDAVDNVAFGFDLHPVITGRHLRVRPNSRNTIPGQVIFTIDSRHPDDKTLAVAGRAMINECERIAGERGLDVSIEKTSHRDAGYPQQRLCRSGSGRFNRARHLLYGYLFGGRTRRDQHDVCLPLGHGVYPLRGWHQS